MTKNELRRFEAILTERIAELERLPRHRDGIVVVRSADQLEEIQQASDRALAVCNLDRDFNHIRNARAALRRIQDGSFGTCLQCDEEIPEKRLRALPFATRCLPCQVGAEQVERRERRLHRWEADFRAVR